MTSIELKALELINKNQNSFDIEDNRDYMLYRLAYNDGVLALLDAIKAISTKPKDDLEICPYDETDIL